MSFFHLKPCTSWAMEVQVRNNQVKKTNYPKVGGIQQPILGGIELAWIPEFLTASKAPCPHVSSNSFCP